VELEEAVRIALNQVIGAYAIVVISKENPNFSLLRVKAALWL